MGQKAFLEVEQKVHQTIQMFKDETSPISRKQQKPPTEKKLLFNLINFPLESTETGATGEGGAYRQVLEQPGSQGVGGHFGENSSFFVVQSFLFWVVIVSSTRRCRTMIQIVT